MKKIKTAKRLGIFPEYVFSKLNDELIKVEKESGRKVLNFGPGNPDFKPSKKYINKLIEFVKDDTAHLYPGYRATDEFTIALIHWYKKRFNVRITSDELLPLLGGKDGISHLPFALLDAKDEVLIPDPGYPAYIGPVLMVGTTPVYYELKEKNDFKIDLKEVENKITRKTKAIIINFPSNPTGQVSTIEELNLIVDFAKSKDLIIIYDNAYSEIAFDDYISPSILQIKGARDIAVEIGSFSKTFSFAGFRMGWIVGNKDIIKAIGKVKSNMDSGLSTPLQKLGAYTLTNFDNNWHKKMIKSYVERRDIIAEHLKPMGLDFDLPKGSLYIWAKIPNNEKNAEEFCMRILKEKQILFTPGTAFGERGERYIRVSICININSIDKYF